MPYTDKNEALASMKRYHAAHRTEVNERRRKNHVANRARDLAQMKAWRKKNPEKFSASQRAAALRRFGITAAVYDVLFASQGGVCAICRGGNKSGRRLAIDHCHETGKIRGLLCASCNVFLGRLEKINFDVAAFKAYIQRSVS